MSTKEPKPIFRMPEDTRAAIVLGFTGRLVDLVWSPGRTRDNEHTVRGVLVCVARIPAGVTGYVAVLADADLVTRRSVRNAVPLSQVRSITEVKA